MLPSPYRPGSGLMPPLLAGRAGPLTRAQASLDRLWSTGAPANPLILTGTRGVGKTVLLHTVAEMARVRRMPAAILTLDRGSSAPQRLASAVSDALAAQLGRRARSKWGKLAERLREFTVEVSVPGVTVTSAPLPGRRPAGVDRDELTRLIAAAATLARDEGHGGLVVIVDEIQEAPDTDLVILVNTFQDTAGRGAPLAVVGAGLPYTPDRLMAAGSFAERFTYAVIGPLTDDESQVALLEPARTAGVAWASDALEAVLSRAQGSPYLLQLFGHAVWEAAAPGVAGGVIGAPAANTGLAAAQTELWDGMFRGRWNRATAAERDLLVAMAGAVSADGTVPTSAVTAALGRTAQQLSVPRRGLIDKGIIAAAGYGKLVFTMPGFEEFVRAETSGR